MGGSPIRAAKAGAAVTWSQCPWVSSTALTFRSPTASAMRSGWWAGSMTITSRSSPTIQALLVKSGCPGASVISFSMFMPPSLPACPNRRGKSGRAFQEPSPEAARTESSAMARSAARWDFHSLRPFGVRLNQVRGRFPM